MTTNEAIELYKKNIDKPKLDMFGGYPAVIDSDSIPGYIVIASTVDGGNKPDLTIYTIEEFIEEMELTA